MLPNTRIPSSISLTNTVARSVISSMFTYCYRITQNSSCNVRNFAFHLLKERNLKMALCNISLGHFIENDVHVHICRTETNHHCQTNASVGSQEPSTVFKKNLRAGSFWKMTTTDAGTLSARDATVLRTTPLYPCTDHRCCLAPNVVPNSLLVLSSPACLPPAPLRLLVRFKSLQLLPAT